MPRCADIIDRVRILSSCDKPVYSQICNLTELATVIGGTVTVANRYAEHTTTQTVTGTNIVVSFIEGAGSFTLAGNTVTLDSASHYKTEPMDGSVTITPNAGAKYHVSWRQV